MDKTKKLSYTKKITATILITIGIIGIFLPLIQGIFFLILGVSILGFDTIREEIEWVKNKINIYNSKKESSYTLKLYLIPLEWILLLEQKKFKKAVNEVKQQVKK